MSSLNVARWCGDCHLMIYPNVPVPRCHIRHGGKGANAIGIYCNTCGIIIHDGIPAPPGHFNHMQRDALAARQRIWDAMIKAEEEPKGTVKIIDKGNYVATGGIYPNEMAVVHEKIAHRIAEKRSKGNQK